jgi:nitrogen regulation protein NR(I)
MWREIKVLLIDDNAQRRHDLKVILDFLGEEAIVAQTNDWRREVEGHVEDSTDISAVILGDSATTPMADVVEAILSWDKGMPILFMGSDSPESMPENLRRALLAAIEMPPSYNKLLDSLHRCQVYREQYTHNRSRGERREVQLFRSLVGTSRQVQHVRELIMQVADKDVSVMIQGESGTGKEVVARNLHYHSHRRNKPFVPVNCGAIPAELLESELFGHEKGAFTGAQAARRGRFEQADGGTLFLDEIGDMPADTQTRLLRVLADGEFYRVGGHTPVKVDVRIIAATHQNLERLVKEGRFREDLFHRLNVIRIHIPKLAERREDIPRLARHFLAHSAEELSVEPKILKQETEEFLCDLPWPGNVRQLENICRWLTVMASGREVLVSDLPTELIEAQSENGPVSGSWEQALRIWADQQLARGQQGILNEAVPQFEKVMIEVALKHTAGRRRDAAQLLGWGRNTLTRKIKELDLDSGNLADEEGDD